MPKTIPSPLPHFVYPPIPETVHPYFQDASRHAFRHGATAFELVNAWWLAEAALLAYADPQLARPAFKKAGLELAADQPFRGESTECYVAHCDDFVIVSFRGTQVFRPGTDRLGLLWDVVRDVGVDAEFCLEEDVEGSGCVHSGFKGALDEIWKPLEAYLQQLARERPNRTFWFTGHSLGAALATLAAVRYPGAKGLYTFGSPLVGDAEFANRLNVPAYRFVNNNDLVTRVPPFGHYKARHGQGQYQHVGAENYIDHSGRIGSERSVVDAVSGVVDSLEDRLREIGKHGWITQQPLDSFNDHGPLYYALHVWNNYESSLLSPVKWPPHYAPSNSPVHVQNELAMQAAPEAVWAWLIRAKCWPYLYKNSANVQFLQGNPPDLAKGTRFRWKTFGVTIESTVLEFVPGERISWDARGLGVDAYHAWVLHRTAQGCHVVTEETQHGWLARAGNLFTPGRMHKYHQLWLEGLRDKAAKGLPPAV